MKNYFFKFGTAMFLLSALFVGVACGDDTPSGGDVVDPPTTPINEIDASFKQSLEQMCTTWLGEYDGWDAVQETNTHIKRELTLNENLTYTNKIQGELKGSGKQGSDYAYFEKESGTFSYNANTGTITFSVKADSVIDYKTQQYTPYTKKHFYDHEDATYTEDAKFTKVTNGQRKWVTKDTYLQSLTDKKLDISFTMDPKK